MDSIQDWFSSTGLVGWMIVPLTLMILPAAIVMAIVRVPRALAIALLVACQLPLLVGIVGRYTGRARADQVFAKFPEPSESDRALYAVADRCLYLGLAAMLVCEIPAVVALVRSRKPEVAAAV